MEIGNLSLIVLGSLNPKVISKIGIEKLAIFDLTEKFQISYFPD